MSCCEMGLGKVPKFCWELWCLQCQDATPHRTVLRNVGSTYLTLGNFCSTSRRNQTEFLCISANLSYFPSLENNGGRAPGNAPAMSQMITFAANSELFRKRKRKYLADGSAADPIPPVLVKEANLGPQVFTARAKRAKSAG